MGKTILAVIAGYAVMVALVMGIHAIFSSTVVLLSLGVVAAFVGGYVAASIKSGKAALYLAILIFVLSIPAFFMGEGEPLWYQILRTILAPVAVLLGSMLKKPKVTVSQ